jgi:hypothetical protein
MDSTHPPLESLLKLSQNSLEGFELSRLNRISNLRNEFHDVLDEWIEFEIEARFARWLIEYRHLRDFDSPPIQTMVPAFAPPDLALRGVARVSDQFLLPSGNELPPEFPFASMVELGASVALELRLPFRHLPVSLDASAALRSLEHFVRCKARAIGDQPFDLLDCDAPDASSSCLFLAFPHGEPAHELRNVSSQMSYVLAATNQSAHSIVRYASTFVTSDHSTPLKPIAPSGLTVLPPPRPRSSRLANGYPFSAALQPKCPVPAFVISNFAATVFPLSRCDSAAELGNTAGRRHRRLGVAPS